MPKFKNGDIIQAKDVENQPIGRDRATVLGFAGMYGTYTIKYKDKTYDIVSQGLIDKHWVLHRLSQSPLYRLLKG